ncbi:MAG TPA: hypothetical protein PLJ26_00470 [Candidatus Omnitrophota bacterium]|nr:hypothetical protein [Candidatus Omnitrophota bacterium]
MENEDIDNLEKSNTIVYTLAWNPVKSDRLKRIRGVSFEDLIIDGIMIDVIDNPARQGQHMLVFEYKKYIWITPCVIENGIFF